MIGFYMKRNSELKRVKKNLSFFKGKNFREWTEWKVFTNNICDLRKSQQFTAYTQYLSMRNYNPTLRTKVSFEELQLQKGVHPNNRYFKKASSLFLKCLNVRHFLNEFFRIVFTWNYNECKINLKSI